MESQVATGETAAGDATAMARTFSVHDASTQSARYDTAGIGSSTVPIEDLRVGLVHG
jgi:hypothetical protein